jgi:ABC-2 type transport system permease protein
MDWGRMWVVARHEFRINVRRLGFIIMTLAVPALAAAVLLFGTFFTGQVEKLGQFLEQQFDIGPEGVGVVDRSGYFSPILPEYEDRFHLYPLEADAQAAVMAEEISSALLIGEDYLETGAVVVVTSGSGFGSALVADSPTVRAFFTDQLLAGKVDTELQERVRDPLDISSRVISSEGDASSAEAGSIAFNFIVPYVLAFLLVTTIFVSSGYLLQSVAEEKESRVVEIVVSSVRPAELMAGKVAGLGALGLVQVLVWAGSLAAFSGGAAVIWSMVGAAVVPARVLLLGALYYLLGYTLYAILMAGIGALGTTMQESQKLAGIFSFFAAIPYLISSVFLADPNAGLVRVLSVFPLTAATTMMMRLPLAEVPWVDVLGSIAALAVSIPAALWVGSRLFEVGVLAYGKRPTLRDIWLILRGKRRTARAK